MRKIIVSEFVTLDNVMEGPGAMDSFKFAGWTMAYGTPEIMKFKYDELFAGDALLLGRITYEGFAAAWPTMTGTGEFGERMNSIQKYVVSNTTKKSEWNNSQLITENIPEQIKKIKEQLGKDILVFGSSALIHTLIEHDLVDEYRLLVYPVVLGAGKRLFKEGDNMKLKLLETKTYSSGVVLLSYSSDRNYEQKRADHKFI